jgi:hypothetical protein
MHTLPVADVDQAEPFFSLLSDDVRDIAMSIGFKNCERLACRIIYDQRVAERNRWRQCEFVECSPEPNIRACDIERVLADSSRPFLVSYDYCDMFARELEKYEPQPDTFELLYSTLGHEEQGTEIAAAYSLYRLGSEMGLCSSVVDQIRGQLHAKTGIITGSLKTLYSGLERSRIGCDCEECRLVTNRPLPCYYDIAFTIGLPGNTQTSHNHKLPRDNRFTFYAALMPDIQIHYFRCDKREIHAAVHNALTHCASAYEACDREMLEKLLITHLELNEDVKAVSDTAALCHHAGDYTRQAEAERGLAELSSRSMKLFGKIDHMLDWYVAEDEESPVWAAIRAYLLTEPIPSSRLLHGVVLADKICPEDERIPF